MAWESNDLNAYNSANIDKRGQISRETIIGNYLYNMAKDENIKNIFEIGTWNGYGSTKCIADGIKERKSFIDFYSIECNSDKCNEAKKIYDNISNIHILNEVLLNEMPENIYEIFPELNENSNYKHWNKIDFDNMKDKPLFLKRENLPQIFDLILLDGGEFTTWFEYLLIKDRCKILALDDTNVLKCSKIVKEIKNNPNWDIILESNERNGILVAKRKENNEENNCKYISARGFSKSSNYNTLNHKFHIDDLGLLPENIKDNDIVHIHSMFLDKFVNLYLPKINKKFILISGDTDYITPLHHPIATQKIIESEFIIHFFVQNCLINHHKITHLPIGLDYHTLSSGSNIWGCQKNPLEQEKEILEILKDSLYFDKRIIKIYSTFHFYLDRGDRREAFENIPKDLIDYESKQVTRIETYRKQIEYAFVASPFGGGPDCHRTWEALILGCIPIVKSSNLDPVFNDLPVLLVKNWSDITQELLDKTIEEFKNKSFKYEKLKLDYWVNLFNSYKE
jgi:hypothetical protein